MKLKSNRLMRALSTFATAVLVATVGLVATGATPALAATFQNPILGQGQDPDILYDGGYYYYTQTNGDAANTLSIRRSTSLATLASSPRTTVWTGGQAGSPCCELWAPELKKINGQWYIYYSADHGTNETHRVYVLQASSPLGPYTYKGMISDSTNLWAIDGTVLQLPNGQLYYFWAGDGPLGIYVARMESPTKISSARTRISTPSYAWETSGAPVNEAPEAIIRGNTINVTYSGSMCWTPDYKLGLITANLSADLLNPASWNKRANPVFQRNDGAGVFGPGHNGFFKSPDGTQDWIVYHAVTNSAGDCKDQRTVRAQPFTWNADGTPNFGSPLGLGTAITLPSGDPGNSGSGAPATRITGPGNKCVDVSGDDNGVNGTAVQLWDCINGAVDQNWKWSGTALSTLNRCLDIVGNGTAQGTLVHLWDCNGAGGQQWEQQANGALRNPQSGRCLDSPNGATANGTRLRIWDCNGAAAQVFRKQ